MASISQFVSEISAGSGLARTSRYNVRLAIPAILQDLNLSGASLQRLILMCHTIDMPGVSIRTNSSVSYVESREVPYKTDYDIITANFYVDGDLFVKAFFDDWIKNIQDSETRNFNYYDDYISPTLDIIVEDLNDNARYGVTLYEVYPKSVGKVTMSYADKNVMTLSVQLQYKFWTSQQVPLDGDGAEGDRLEIPPYTGGMFNDNFSLDQIVGDFNDKQSAYEQLLNDDYFSNTETDPIMKVTPIVSPEPPTTA